MLAFSLHVIWERLRLQPRAQTGTALSAFKIFQIGMTRIAVSTFHVFIRMQALPPRTLSGETTAQPMAGPPGVSD